jgi:hypothetical protein
MSLLARQPCYSPASYTSLLSMLKKRPASSSEGLPITPFCPSTRGAAGHRSGSPYLTRLHSQFPTNTSHPHAESNDAVHASLVTILFCFHRSRHTATDQPTPTKNPCQTDAGMTKPVPLQSGPQLPLSTQHLSKNWNAEMAPQDLAWSCYQRASPDTPANACSSGREDSSTDSHEDDAQSDYIEVISDNEEDGLPYVRLVANNPRLHRPAVLSTLCDTGATLCVLTHAKADVVAPDSLGDEFFKSNPRIVTVLGSKVPLHGPIRMEFCLWKNSKHHYEAPFYVLPSNYKTNGFDALLNFKAVRRIGFRRLGLIGNSARSRRGARRAEMREKSKRRARPWQSDRR